MDNYLLIQSDPEQTEELYPFGQAGTLPVDRRPMAPPRQRFHFNFAYFFLILLIAAAAAIYAYGISQWEGRFLNRTSVNGLDVSGKSPEEVEEMVRQTVDDYSITITFRGGQTETLTGGDIGYTYVPGNTIKDLAAGQNYMEWPLAFFRDTEYQVDKVTEYDSDKACEAIRALPEFQEENQTQPTDAYLVMREKGLRVVPEEEGNAVRPKTVVRGICSAIDERRTEIDVEKDIKKAYKVPAVRSDNKDLLAEKKRVNDLISAKITYILPEGDEPMSLGAETLKGWLSMDENGRYYKDDAVWADKIMRFVDQIAINVNTVWDSRKFKATGIGTITVPGGEYGWSVNKEAEKALLAEELAAHEEVTREPKYYTREYSSENGGIGDTYIEADLTRQHVWIYRDGKMVLDTDCVSGLPTPERHTPTGVYMIMYKETDTDLRGRMMPDGNYAYVSHVDYWMPFYDGCGFHDASWQARFGGDWYKSHGSRGCINLPPSIAGRFYQNVDEDMVVVVYSS